jgi:hypothetical protein
VEIRRRKRLKEREIRMIRKRFERLKIRDRSGEKVKY